MEIISEPEQVTAAWLTEVLNHAGYDGEVIAFSASNVGTGQVGQNVRFTFTERSGKLPDSIVGKFASGDPTSRATGVAHNNYLKEVRFYQELHPLVKIQTPKVLFTSIDPETHAFCLMMEDLHPAQQGNQIEGCDVSEARTALIELAKLHAPTWNRAGLTEHEWLGANAGDRPEFLDFWTPLYQGFLSRYRERLSDDHLDALKAFDAKAAQWPVADPEPFALTHGDYRLDNMLFGGPYPLAVVDWQTVSIGHPASDVSYFLGAGLLPEVRREVEVELVTEYHAALAAQGVAHFPLNACYDAYRRYSYAGLVMAVVASMIVEQTERGDDMFMAMATRHAQQALDLNAEALLV